MCRLQDNGIAGRHNAKMIAFACAKLMHMTEDLKRIKRTFSNQQQYDEQENGNYCDY